MNFQYWLDSEIKDKTTALIDMEKTFPAEYDNQFGWRDNTIVKVNKTELDTLKRCLKFYLAFEGK